MAHVLRDTSGAAYERKVMKDGCVYRCLDRECNLPTFEMDATCCAHCGNTKLQAEHLNSEFDPQRQAFVCRPCDVETDHKLTGRLRGMARRGELDLLAPGLSSLLDLTDH